MSEQRLRSLNTTCPVCGYEYASSEHRYECLNTRFEDRVQRVKELIEKHRDTLDLLD